MRRLSSATLDLVASVEEKDKEDRWLPVIKNKTKKTDGHQC